MKPRCLLLPLSVILCGCSESLVGTRWVSTDYSDDNERIIMIKEMVFIDKSKYSCVINNLVNNEIDTIYGNYTYSNNIVYFDDEDSASATVNKKAMIANIDFDEDEASIYTFIKQ